MTDSKDKIRAFLADYKALVLKHGLCIDAIQYTGEDTATLYLSRLNVDGVWNSDEEAASAHIESMEKEL